MLSIGKLVAGQATYYLDHAEARVDVATSIGDGVEDYYFGGHEARGTWIGAGAERVGLAGGVGASELRRLLEGQDPTTGESLRASASQVRVAGFDLTFSAPKSVSVLFGIGDEPIRDAVRRAHDRAVAEAVAYLEETAAAVRRGRGGATVLRAEGLVAAAFRHRTSRAADPQLHTHVLVANVGRGSDGKWSALDARRIYSNARAASFVYQAVLRGELTRSLGVAWSTLRAGIAEIEGVPVSVRHDFSRRRAEIDAALEERGSSTPRAAEAAALATRRKKERDVDPAHLIAEWRARAAELGFPADAIREVLARARAPELDSEAWQKVAVRLAAPDGLTQRRSTFTRRDVVQGICEKVPVGARVDARTLLRAAEQFLVSELAVPLVPDGDSNVSLEAFRTRDGRRVPVVRDELRYSTPELLAIEQEIVDSAIDSQAAGTGLARQHHIDHALRTRPSLSEEQFAMVRTLTTAGAGVAVVAGRAGTGKTYALAAAHEAWSNSGFPVVGVAVARRAARELQTGSGIPSTSVAALLGSLREGERLPPHAVLVVDEAGMVATRQLAALLAHIKVARGKLVLVGDHRQLPELEAGGAFRGLVRRGLAVELKENHRQAHAWERKAVDYLRGGRPEAALDLYRQHERITITPTRDEARDQLVKDWWATGDTEGSVMIAARRVDVADLNRRAREHMRGAGRLGDSELRLPTGEFAVGDIVVVKRSDLRRGLFNGDRARVVRIHVTAAVIELDRAGSRVTVGPGFLHSRTDHGEAALVHGYAITGHVAQGASVTRAFVLATDGLSREWGYTTLTRGRESNHLYLADEPDPSRSEYAPGESRQHRRDAVEVLAEALRTSTANVLALDVAATDRGVLRQTARSTPGRGISP